MPHVEAQTYLVLEPIIRYGHVTGVRVVAARKGKPALAQHERAVKVRLRVPVEWFVDPPTPEVSLEVGQPIYPDAVEMEEAPSGETTGA